MIKKSTTILAFITLGFTQSNSQNVGIGTATPTTKTHIVQTADVTALEIDHGGATGNTIIAFPQAAANTSSTVWVLNGTSGAGINLDMLTTTSTATGMIVDNEGLGAGIFVQNDNAANTFSGMQVNHSGTGYGTLLNMTNTGAGGTGLYIDQDGTGAFSRGFEIAMDAANNAIGSAVFHSGTGMGAYVGLTNLTSTSMGQAISNDGLGRGLQIALGNTANTEIGASIFHSGTGIGLYSQTQGQGVVGISTGTGGRGGTFQVNNAAANTNSIGLFVIYDGNTAGGTGGGGNAIEVQHNGAIGNAIDVFMGSPAAAAGPANTLSDYSCISASHMGTGAGVAGFKSALSATANGADPAIIAFNDGADGGYGVHAQAVPNGAAHTRAVYGYAIGNIGLGYGGYFTGGWRGLYASVAAGGSGYGIMSGGDLGATGTKTFLIDHPLDPENKELRHYSIESNEVLNMYRGVAQLDASGLAVVQLPAYFDKANKDVTYQLTPIGTASQPYVAVEEANNQFTVAGAPGTKVSWTIHAKRNDATLQYYDGLGRNYSNAEPEKPAHLKGKYHVPEVYGKDQSFAIDQIDTKIVERVKENAKNQKAMSIDGKSNQADVQDVDVKVSPKKTEPDVTSSDVIKQK